jgi:uncharacterized protein
LQSDTVRIKKYLYVLRPVLAAQWVIQRQGSPPLAFEELVAAMIKDPAVLGEIEELLIMKRESGEKDLFAKRPILNDFLERSFAQLANYKPEMVPINLAVLDQLFFATVLG